MKRDALIVMEPHWMTAARLSVSNLPVGQEEIGNDPAPVECPYCHGSGVCGNNAEKECPYCDGTGEVDPRDVELLEDAPATCRVCRQRREAEKQAIN